MNGPAHAALSDSNAGEALEREVDEAVAICGGDMRAALKAALVANSFLAAEVEELMRVVSFGFTRGRHSAARRASEKLDEWREISSGSVSLEKRESDEGRRTEIETIHGSPPVCGHNQAVRSAAPSIRTDEQM